MKTHTKSIEIRALEWATSSDVGISSMTILHVMTGAEWTSQFKPRHPLDSDDFGRCHRLLDRIPEWRDHLDLVSGEYPQWKELVDNWGELEALYRDSEVGQLNDRIQQLAKEVASA